MASDDARVGHATISIAVAASVFPARVRAQLYRVPAGVVLDKAVHRAGAPFDLPSGTTTTYINGDNTHESLLSDGNFDDPALWSGANWAVSGGVASHTPHAGTDSLLVQAIALPAAGFRFDYTVIGRTARSIRMQLAQTGGAGVVQGPEVTDNGHARGALLSALTSDAVQFLASADFDGAIGQAILFRLTSACVEAGEYDYYLEPLNLDEIPAGVSGPFTVRIG